jgi:phosphatidylethanolamine-binding protein (PEBP) family uncharacterized protein
LGIFNLANWPQASCSEFGFAEQLKSYRTAVEDHQAIKQLFTKPDDGRICSGLENTHWSQSTLNTMSTLQAALKKSLAKSIATSFNSIGSAFPNAFS